MNGKGSVHAEWSPARPAAHPDIPAFRDHCRRPGGGCVDRKRADGGSMKRDRPTAREEALFLLTCTLLAAMGAILFAGVVLGVL